jgi:hypothetical protein
MEVTAIRPDRDVIGKQKNPRKKKLLLMGQSQKSDGGGGGGSSASSSSRGGDPIGGGPLGGGETCCLPSPGTESNGSVFCMLNNYILIC